MAFNIEQPAYEDLRSVVAERTTPLLAWVGSGLSIPAGLPSWSGLKEHLVVVLEAKAADMEPRDERQIRGKVEAIRRQPNLWTSFKMLREALGQTTYRESIRAAFSSADTVAVPAAYRELWRLRVRGVLNLNLDRLATRAYTEDRPGGAFAEFSGRDVSRLRQLLHGHQPIVANLHGISQDSGSWVLTRDELSSLRSDPAYTSFIETCLSTHVVLFLGISADDPAVGGFLEQLSAMKVETPAHYWLTNRRDFNTDRWAEDAGIRVIRYDSSDDHSGVKEFFHDLKTYLPEDPEDAFLPVSPARALEAVDPGPGAGELPPLSNLLQMEAEDLRVVLNAKATKLLESESEDDFSAYEQFSQTYGQAIYRAWYTSTDPGENVLLGYELQREVAEGSFGKVYVARSPSGEQVAVKVLLGEVRTKPELLKSFRRGVRSMRILHNHQVDGMVDYLAASEIPAFVVMEWIEGPNLAEAKRSGYLEHIHDLLTVAVQLANVVRAAHELPERVLHRDLRPSNVMLSGYYADPSGAKVVVLDFDLSWHKGAFERSVIHTSAAGYLAPEQMRDVRGISTRNAAVDSFGLGMTLFYLCSGEDPAPEQHRHQEWDTQVRRACSGLGESGWKSAPERLARLILAATQDKQAARWDMAEITGELKRLSSAVTDPDSVSSAELLAEEVAARTDVFQGYEWVADRVGAIRRLPTGLELKIEALLESEAIQVTIEWASTGTEERRNLGKYVLPAARSSVEQLKASGWTIVNDQIEKGSATIQAIMASDSARGQVGEVAASIDTAIDRLRRIGS